LAEIPSVVIKELHDAIEADLHQPTVSKMAKRVAAVRESRQIDETDPNLVGLFEPNFSDREHRTPEQVRKLADEAVRDLRQQGKGNKPYYPQPEGIDPATKCALIISIKLNWPGSEPDKLRPLARPCTRPQAVTLRAHQIAPMDFGETVCVRRYRSSGAIHYIVASSNAP
jgi:hypothetical protein